MTSDTFSPFTHLRLRQFGKGEPRYTLQLSIGVLFSILIVALGAALIGYSYEKNRTIALLTASDLFDHVSHQTAARVSELYAPIETLVDLTANLTPAQGKSFDERLELFEYFTESLRRNEQLSAIYVGYSDGEFFLVRAVRGDPAVRASASAPEAAAFVVQSIERGHDGMARYETVYFDEALNRIGDENRFNTGYDPRIRGWYQAAIRSSERITTSFYVFFTTREIGTTIARALPGGAGVVGADLTIQDLSAGIETQSITPSTEIVVFDANGAVLGYRDAQRLVYLTGGGSRSTVRIAHIADMDQPILDELFRAFVEGARDTILTLEEGGRHWFGSVAPLALDQNRGVHLAILVPEDELLVELERVRFQSMLISLAMLLIAITLAWWLSRSIARPVRALAEEAEKIRQVELDAPVTVRSSLAEVDKLASTMAVMKVALNEREQRYRDVVEMSTDWIWETDELLRFTYISEPVATLIGGKPAELYGKTGEELMREFGYEFCGGGEREDAYIAALKARQAFERVPYQRTLSDGSVRYVEISGCPIWDRNGRFSGYRGTGTDVSALKNRERELAESTTLLRTVLDTIDQGFSVFDSDYRLALVSRNYAKLLDYPPELDRLGVAYETYVRYHAAQGDYGPGDPEKRVKRILKNTRRGVHGSWEWRRKNGRILAYSTYPMPKGGFVTTLTDITVRRRAEGRLRDAYGELEEKVAERTQELVAANARLKELDQLKSMFIASMSHELRTPLNSIIGFTGVLLQGMSGELNEKQKDQLSRVYGASTHLLGLITDVIDISKIEAGRIDIFPEDLELNAVMDDVLDTVRPQLSQKGLELEVCVQDDVRLYTDKKKLMQCLINMLSNAVKFTDTGKISVEARKTERRVEFVVRDTGIGIPEQHLSKLFQPFERIDSHLRVKTPGTGLGLYVTMKIATELLNGGISVESREGEGSTFTLTVPSELEVDAGVSHTVVEGG